MKSVLLTYHAYALTFTDFEQESFQIGVRKENK
jgi:hypothetical protein